MASQGPSVQDPSVQDIVGRISHDLRSSVRAMVQLASWIEEDCDQITGPVPESLKENLGLMQVRGQRLRNLVTDLTTFAQIGLSDGPFDGDWDGLLLDLRNALPEVWRFDLHLQIDAAPSMARDDLFQLLSALLANAVRHHHEGSGHLALEVRADGTESLIHVTDDGPGIAPEHRARVMEPLTTLQSRDVVEGSGMGLAIASGIAGHYGGHLVIEDAPGGQGCRVTVSLPITQG